MKQSVQIVRYDKPFAVVKSDDDRSRSCCRDHCPMATFSRLLRMSHYTVPTAVSFVPHEKAYLHIDDKVLLRVAVRHYGLPLSVLIVSALIGNGMGWHDLVCAGFSIGAYVLCQLWLMRRPLQVSTAAWRLTPVD